MIHGTIGDNVMRKMINGRVNEKSDIFHVHTNLCRHATIEPEEAVLAAIRIGAKSIWFSDHAPFPEDPFRLRMKMDELPIYLTKLQGLQKRYLGQIQIYIGLEIEFLQSYHKQNYYQSLFDAGIEFLLLGQHFSEIAGRCYTFQLMNHDKEYHYLAESILEGVETGMFFAVSHPEQIFRSKKVWDEEIDLFSKRLIEASAWSDVLLEKNIGNMQGKKKRAYRAEFWNKILAQEKMIYGVDAHSLDEMRTNYLLQQEFVNNKR